MTFCFVLMGANVDTSPYAVTVIVFVCFLCCLLPDSCQQHIRSVIKLEWHQYKSRVVYGYYC